MMDIDFGSLINNFPKWTDLEDVPAESQCEKENKKQKATRKSQNKGLCWRTYDLLHH